MGANFALPILTGLFGGAGSGLYKGMEQGTQDAMAQQRIDQGQQNIDLQRETQRRMMDQFQQSQYTNIPGNMLSSDMRGGVDPATGTLRVQSHLVPAYLGANEREIARGEQAKKASALGMAIAPMAAKDPMYKALQDALSSGADTTQLAPIFENLRQHQLAQQQQEQGRSMIAPLYKLLGMEMPTPPQPVAPTGAMGPASIIRTGGEPPVATAPGPEGIPRTLPTPQQPGVQAAGRDLGNAVGNLNAAASGLPGVPSQAPSGAPPSGYQKPILTFDPVKGTVSVAAHPEPPAQPGTEFVRAVNEKQALQRAGVPANDPRYGPINDRIDYYKAIAVAPGGNVYGLGSNPPSAPGTAPGAAPGAPRPPARPMITGPEPISTPQEVKAATDKLSLIRQMTDTADLLDEYRKGLSAKDSAYFAARVGVQGNPLTEWIPGVTSKKEQQLMQQIQSIKTEYENAKAGVRGVSNAQIQPTMGRIVGSPGSAATPTLLRNMARILQDEVAQEAATNKAGGRRDLSGGTPPPPGPPQPPGTPPPGPDGRIKIFRNGQPGSILPGDFNPQTDKPR